MSEPFVAEIRVFAFNFAPRGWAFCDGQMLPISQNTALFSLIGTTYGGDGRTTMGLPDMQARLPMHPGRGPGLTARRLGERSGETTVTLTEAQMPSHSHLIQGVGNDANNGDPTGRTYATSKIRVYASPGAQTQMADNSLKNAGGNAAHNNMQPSLALNFCIALVGTYPSRS